MLPNMAEPLLILSATVFALSLVEISALSFIGLGVQSPDTTSAGCSTTASTGSTRSR